MKKIEPFKFDNFDLSEEKIPLFDLSVNRRTDNKDDISKVLSKIDNTLKQMLDESNKESLHMLKSILEKISPVLLKKESLEIVADFIAANFDKFKKEKVLKFYLHPDIIYDIGNRIASLAERSDYEGRISLQKDSAIEPCDCKIAWKDGEVKYDSKEIMAEIMAITTR